MFPVFYKRRIVDQIFDGANIFYNSIRGRIVDSFKTNNYEYVELDDRKHFKRHVADTLFSKCTQSEYKKAKQDFENERVRKQLEKCAHKQLFLSFS